MRIKLTCEGSNFGGGSDTVKGVFRLMDETNSLIPLNEMSSGQYGLHHELFLEDFDASQAGLYQCHLEALDGYHYALSNYVKIDVTGA